MHYFKRLFGKRDETPLDNVEEVTRILEHLPQSDPTHSLNEITHWLELIATKEDYKLKKRLKLAERFDQSAQQHLRKLLTEYVEAPRMHKSREETIWNACSQFTLAVNEADSRCVTDYITKGSEGVSAEEIAAIAVRGMRALGMQAHLLHLRYQPLPASMWDKIYAIFNIAEQRRFCRMPVVLNAYTKAETSVLLEMLKILMMVISAPESLTKSQIELCRQLVEEFSSSFVWEDLPAGETVFNIDFSTRKPPTRLTHLSKPHFMTRCFGPGNAVSAMVIAVKQLESGAIPKSFDIQRFSNYKREDLLEVLMHLSMAWSKVKPQDEHSHFDKRRSSRNKVYIQLDVVHGLERIYKKVVKHGVSSKKLFTEDHLNKIKYDEMVDLHIFGFVTNKTREGMNAVPLVDVPVGEPGQIESWVVENISDKGCGLTIPTLKQDWVQENVLLGLKMEGGGWSLGLIRRIEAGSNEDTRVGIRKLSLHPLAASISPANTELTVWETAGDTRSFHHTNALLLLAEPPLLGEDCLILAAGSYALHKIYELSISEGKRLIRLDVCEERYQGADRVIFSLVENKQDRKLSAS